jgi:precorrin-2 dehydrogenase / sirohydrochlorin ferrochelatase
MLGPTGSLQSTTVSAKAAQKLGLDNTNFSFSNLIQQRKNSNRRRVRLYARIWKMRLFPLFLKLSGRHCLVIGGGKISQGKVAGLLSSGAKITLVAPKVTPRIAAWSRGGRLRWVRRKFRSSDLRGIFLAVAATSSSPIHRAIFRQCKKRGILCNIVDVPELCDFYYPAVVQRGDLQIAISTGGSSPSLAKRLREQFERELGPEYAHWVRAIARERQKIRNQRLTPAEQIHLLKTIASEGAFSDFQRKFVSRSTHRRPV